MNRIARYRKVIQYVPIAAMLIVTATAPAFANTANGIQPTGLPWETPLTTIQNSLTGPVAVAISVIALFAAGAGLVFGDEMSNFVKRVLIGVMALALLIAGSGFLSHLSLGVSGFAI
jgi:type IV secretory pathway VirB2 component (pilin)